MAKSRIAILILILLAVGVYVLNSMAGKAAERELDALLAPKFAQADASYEGLSVNPIGGSVTLFDIRSEGGEISVEEITITSNYEDILAAAQGTPDILHGLKVQAQNLHLQPERDELIRMDQATFAIDGDIDINRLADAPEAWMMAFLSQEEAHISTSGSGWMLQGEDLTEDFGTGTSVIRFDDISMVFEKDGDALDANFSWTSPDLGEVSMELAGDDDGIENFAIDIEDLQISPEDDVTFQFGEASFSTSGNVPYANLSGFDPEDLVQAGTAVEWLVHMRDFVMISPDLAGEIGSDRISFDEFDHTFAYSVDHLETTLNYSGNLGAGDMEMDCDIFSHEPPSGNVNTMELSLSDLPPAIRSQLANGALPLEADGDDGYTFSYSGPLAGLLGL